MTDGQGDYGEFIKKAQSSIEKLLHKKCPEVCQEKKLKILQKLIDIELEQVRAEHAKKKTDRK